MILRKETETNFSSCYSFIKIFFCIRMNDTPQGDGNLMYFNVSLSSFSIRMNDTPQGDGNSLLLKCR